ncbi:MAG: hypothetical protein ACSHX5_00005, partial [Phycisphaerales bacterium]
MNYKNRILSYLILALLLINPPATQAQPQKFLVPSGFTYQGYLEMDGEPFTGSADFFFELFDGFSQVFGEIILDQPVIDGKFSLKIDLNFVDINGNPLQLEVSVRTPPGVGEYTKLSPRQDIISVPYAMQASSSATSIISNSLKLPTTLETFVSTESPSLIISQPYDAGGVPLRLTRTNSDDILEQYVPRVLEAESSDTPVGILATAQTFAIAGVIDSNASLSGAAVLGQVNPGAPSSQVGVQALNQVGGTQALLATPDYAAVMIGEVRVLGDITKSYALGAYDLAAPIAYGVIDSNGSIISGTPNFSCVYNSALARYEIEIDDEFYTYQNYVTVATPLSPRRFVTTSSSSGRLIVQSFYLFNNTYEEGFFQFATYKPNGAALIQGQQR